MTGVQTCALPIFIISLLKSQCYLADHKSSANRGNSIDTFLVGLVGKLEYPLKKKIQAQKKTDDLDPLNEKESGIEPGHVRVPLFEGQQFRKTHLFGLITIHDLLCSYLKVDTMTELWKTRNITWSYEN